MIMLCNKYSNYKHNVVKIIMSLIMYTYTTYLYNDIFLQLKYLNI